MKLKVVVCGGVIALAGCGGGLEGELLDALQADDQVELRVGPSVLGVDAVEADDGRRYVAKAGAFSFMNFGGGVDALGALREEGFVSDEVTVMPQGFGSSVEAFAITKKGDEYFRPDAFGAGIDVWIGEKQAVEIVEYTEPAEGGPQMIQARFRYEVELNDLADELGMEEEIRREVERSWPGEGVAMYVKTNKGWRLEMAMWQ